MVEFEPNMAFEMVIHEGPALMRRRTIFEMIGGGQTAITTTIEIPGMDDSMDKSFLYSRLERSQHNMKHLMETEL